ncbi:MULTISPECIES: ATP-binding cassette domain-containing protein [unclassified Streptomyces]|uniref:ATP-binding cassette domain-containing protein n=1 Tax=unclassified Streptomyces TaxID=2593676 RepID=UPI002E76FF1B|nr:MULTISPECIES: ATP-binding cassette domain-containing protein [unclassified Streptomyces]MEE1766037.1 ATP-binding cassette domain-containing protein [Streptomyces sp. SP18BB07]MEE1834815.1 ATP-binding cassette domain-containing protein [Streptomyces sp. SP17KL33]
MTLELVDCTYAYSRRKAPILRDFSYGLADGLTILLGPNGAGKSTLLKLAASVHRPSSGTVTLDGVPSHAKSYRRDVAWMPQDITPMPSLTAREYVAYIGWLKGMARGHAWDRALHALARVELTKQADIRTSQLSGGQLRRVGVAGALVHDARVLLLDEPTAGMDPRQRRVFRDVLGNLTDDVRVLMSTHDVADLAEEADQVTVLYGGEILQTGPTRSFLAHTPPDTAPGRAAEGAYTALLMRHGAE